MTHDSYTIEQDQLKNELREKKKQRLQENNDALGVGNAGDNQDNGSTDTKKPTYSSTSTTIGAAPAGIHPLTIFLAQRPEPTPLPTVNTSSNIGAVSKSLIHAAGGYDYSNFDKRNWREIKSQITHRS